jgi:hypothetical protein
VCRGYFNLACCLVCRVSRMPRRRRCVAYVFDSVNGTGVIYVWGGGEGILGCVGWVLVWGFLTGVGRGDDGGLMRW